MNPSFEWHGPIRAVAFCLFINTASGAALGIINGNFETDAADNAAPPSGWSDLSTSSSFWTGVPDETGNPSSANAASAPAPGIGTYFLTTARQSVGVGSQPENGTLVQTVELSAAATAIDGGGHTITVNFAYASGDDRDSAIFSLHFFSSTDGSGDELGTGYSEDLLPSAGSFFGGWQEVSVGGLVPAGARSVTLRIDTTRTGGSETNVYFDNFTAELVGSDSDNDGLNDSAELAGTDNDGVSHGFGPTNPHVPDTDKDSYGDAVEIAAGSDPNSPASMPPATTGNPRSLPLLSEALEPGGFSILAAGNAVAVVYDSTDAKVVEKAILLLANDVEAVSGVRPVVSDSADGITGSAILVGTLGRSPLIDGLVDSGKLDVSAIRGNWESYRLTRVVDPLPGIPEALVVVGSDRRGTAYGLGAISEAMGVSPWTWWADVPPPARSEIHLAGLPLDSIPPSVRFRGIFINDEDWGLQEWAEKNYEAGPEEVKDIGPKTYAKVFELLLRLRSNYCWPGMHPSTRAFHFYAENKQVADDYAIVMGSSHAEPMLRNNVDEWSRFTSDNGYSNNWNYSQNKNVICEYWDIRAQETAPFENTYVVGKRGIHDSGMVEGSNNTEKAAWLNTIFADQREILANRVNPDPTQVPQIFVPYKEVLSIYDTGLVNVPDDVTLIWPDDNHGYIRRLSNSAEQQRGGGGGIYYHLSYWGAPQDYLWLSTIPPSLIWEEMMKAYENQCHRLWVFNVGDIKPAEINMEYALRLAWNVHSYGSDSQTAWLKEWAAREFGTKSAGAIASVMNDYYLLNHARKPEHLDWKDSDAGNSAPSGATSYSLFSQVHEGDELATRLAEFELLRERVDQIYDAIPADRRDAFYQLAVYPVRGSEAMNRKFLHTARAQRAVAQKRKTASLHSSEATSAYNEISTETAYYNTTMASGKWNEMMDWKPRALAVFNLPSQPSDPGPQSVGLGVAVEGRLTPVFTSPGGGVSNVELHAVDDAVSITAPMQETTLDGRRCLWTPGTGGAAAAGAGGRATYSFNIAEAGTYAIRFEVRTPNANDDSWHIALDGATPEVWNNLGVGDPTGWRWQTWKSVLLSAGTHSLVVHEREDGAAFAAIEISNTLSTATMGEDPRFSDFRLPEFNSITRRSFFVDLINTEAGPISWSATADNPWVVLSDTSGAIDAEQRIAVSIDWDQLPADEHLVSAIHVQQGANTINVPVTVWNPSSPPAADFIEENGAIIIEAEHPSASHAGTDASWEEIPNLGRGDGAMIVQPTTAPSLTTTAEIVANAPSLEYSFHLRTPGSHRIEAVFLPALSLNNDRGRRYAVSVDGASPTMVSLSSESGSGSTWSRSVLRSAIAGNSTHSIASAGNHTLKIWMVDPGLVLDRLGIFTATAPYTYAGFQETSVDSAETLYVAAGETFVLTDESRTFKRIVNHGTLEVRSSAVMVTGDLINFGTLRVIGTSTLTAGGNVSNFGLVDSMSWQSGGVSELPDYSDFGSMMDSSFFQIESHWMDEGGFHIQVPGYEGHRYALQRNVTLTTSSWVSSGQAQDGSGVLGNPSPLTFTWPVDASRMFFRVELDGAE